MNARPTRALTSKFAQMSSTATGVATRATLARGVRVGNTLCYRRPCHLLGATIITNFVGVKFHSNCKNDVG